jgi:DNA ligase-associated metallophosphoesterase
MQLSLNNSTFTLLPEKALYKEDERLLIIADVHLGKASHFRKEGVYMPPNAHLEDYEALRRIFDKLQPRKVYFLGDLFHSKLNKEWDLFAPLIREYDKIAFTLILGNHDIIDTALFLGLNIVVVNESIEEGAFIYSHMPVETPADAINIVGHIHPGILLEGKARQSVRLPCYHLCGNTLLLPAFGKLTGLFMIDCKKEDRVFAVLPSEVIEIK